MYSFYALIWDPKDDSAAREVALHREKLGAATRSTRSFIEAPGFLLCSLSAHRITPLESADGTLLGAVFGTVFERNQDDEPQASVTQFTSIESQRLSDGVASGYPKNYWGNNIFFVRSPDGMYVMPDPTSAIPCFYSRRNKFTSVFSNFENSERFAGGQYTINYAFIEALLVYDKIQDGRTGLKEVFELAGGEVLNALTCEKSDSLAWDPRPIARNPLPLKAPHSAARLASLTRMVVGSWSRQYERVLLELSGGLDSAIVLSALSEIRPRSEVIALHYLFDSGDHSELEYAKIAAQRAGVALEIAKQDPRAGLPDIDSHPLTARPYRQFVSGDLTSLIEPGLLKSSDGLFTGQGGDHLFFGRRAAPRFADYLIVQGLGFDVGRELVSEARLSGKSIWSVLRTTSRVIAKLDLENHFEGAMESRRTIFNDRAYRSRGSALPVPVWARQRDGLPPAKFGHVQSIAHMLHNREPIHRGVDIHIVHPLISRPLIEFCLQTPTYILGTNGEPRGLARQAFLDAIPPEIRKRKTKAYANRYFVALVEHNKGRIIDALSNGELARTGLVEPTLVKKYLESDAPYTAHTGRTLLTLYAIEAWLRAWARALNGGA